MKRIAVVSRY